MWKLLNLNFVLDHHLTLVPLARNLGYFAPGVFGPNAQMCFGRGMLTAVWTSDCLTLVIIGLLRRKIE